jgi:DTW domain-containing protein YfiP
MNEYLQSRNRINPNPHPMVVFATEHKETEQMIMERINQKQKVVILDHSEKKGCIKQNPSSEE